MDAGGAPMSEAASESLPDMPAEFGADVTDDDLPF